MSLIIDTPTTLRIHGHEEKRLHSHLDYIDKRVDHEIARLKRNAQYIHQGDTEAEEKYREELAALKAQRKGSLLFTDDNGFYTMSGLRDHLSHGLGELSIENRVEYPEPDIMPWHNEPEHAPRPYQIEAHDNLLAAKHAAVEIGTGLGKSKIIEMLVKSLGLKTVVMAPSVNIAEQLYAMFVSHFGKRRVGMFFDGKKDCDKEVTVAVAASLMRVERGSEVWRTLASSKVFIADESHMTPADTLRVICMELFAAVPYRFFFSGTQTRTDGQELVLKGITGPIVYRMTVREGVDQGWLAKPIFRVIPVDSDLSYKSPIVDRMTNKHLRYNPQVLARAALIANKSIEAMKRQTVILIDEIPQFMALYPMLRHRAEFAHGPLDAKGKKHVPKEFWKSDPHEQVARFNRGEIPLLVGTSCISIGTDLQTVGSIIYLVGGMSEIAVKQAVGRGTRGGVNSTVVRPEGATLWPWGDKKTDCYFFDFDVRTPHVSDDRYLSSVERHSAERRAYFEDVYGPIKEFRVDAA